MNGPISIRCGKKLKHYLNTSCAHSFFVIIFWSKEEHCSIPLNFKFTHVQVVSFFDRTTHPVVSKFGVVLKYVWRGNWDKNVIESSFVPLNHTAFYRTIHFM